MKITFLRTVHDRYTHNERYGLGDKADLPDRLARVLLERGDAVEGWGESEGRIVLSPDDAVPPFADASENEGEAKNTEPADPLYDEMKVADLKSLASCLGVVGYSTMRRAELIAALEGSENG